MSFLPIVERELRIKARRSRTYFARCRLVLVFAVLIFGIIALEWNLGKDPTVIGRDLFLALSALGFAYALVAGPVVTADCLSEEKREGTLGLLMLTNLKGHDIVLGKLAATALPSIYAFVAGLPVLALPFFLGGVTVGEFWRMTVVLLATLWFSLTIGMLVSTLSRDGRRAFLTTALVVALCTISPWLWGFLLTRTVSSIVPPLPSPGYAISLVSDARYSALPAGFWWASTSLLFLSVLALALAGVLLPRNWQERTLASKTSPAPSGERGFSVFAIRQGRRKRLLGRNPILWLAERTALNRFAVLACWILSMGFWAFGLAAIRRRLIAPEVAFLTVYGLHAAMKGWVAWEATRRFSEDRRNGSLELLLVTPLSERAILAGWLKGLIRRFVGPVALLLSFDWLLWQDAPGGVWLLVILGTSTVFLADGYTLCWVGLWMGLTQKNSTQAFNRTVLYVLLYPWVGFLLIQGLFGIAAGGNIFPREPLWLVAPWFVAGYLLDLGFCIWSVGKLGVGFRAASSNWSEATSS